MASKSELLDAQNFSRRRLLTAFVSGAPGGKELEPAKPLRGVIAGVVLSIAVLLVGWFLSFNVKALPEDWGTGKLIIDTTTGSRYVTADNTLHPVLNIASARLLLSAEASADPIEASGSLLVGKPVGTTVGIPGAPDTMPTPDQLINTAWTACIADDTGGVATSIDSSPIAEAAAAGTAIVARAEKTQWVVAGGTRFQLPKNDVDGLLRDIGLGSAPRVEVSTNWLNLFALGSPLTPTSVRDAGRSLVGSDLKVGDVVHTTITDSDARYLVMSDGSLAELTPFGLALYQHGTTYSPERNYDVDAPQVASLPTSAEPAQPQDWPVTALAPAAGTPCALAQTNGEVAQTVLATAAADAELSAGTTVEPSMGALVAVAGADEGAASLLMLIDPTATQYAIPGADDELLAQLGYTSGDIGHATPEWMALFDSGPALTRAAAGATSG